MTQGGPQFPDVLGVREAVRPGATTHKAGLSVEQRLQALEQGALGRPGPGVTAGSLVFSDSTRHGGVIWRPGLPIGCVQAFAGSSAPSGWLLCYGQAVSRTTYADLFTVISTTYGTGDGSTTFNVPDLRGRVVAGLDNMGGSDAGRLDLANTRGTTTGAQYHTLTTSEIPDHRHELRLGTAGATGYDDYAARANSGADAGFRTGKNRENTSGFGSNGYGSTDTTTDQPHNNMQPTMVLNQIIYAGA